VPEAPELQVVKEVLGRVLPGQSVVQAHVRRPTVLRVLTPGEFTQDIAGRAFQPVTRHGKSLIFAFSGDRLLVIFPMLTGGLQYCSPTERVLKSTAFVLSLSGGMELRYFDEKQMGMAYYLSPGQAGEVKRMEEQGPDVFDQPLSYEEFLARLKPFRGEIKGVLTRGHVVSGIGNAYADEVLFEAGIFPFRKRSRLTDEELRRLHAAIYAVPRAALETLRERMGDQVHLKPRDFLKVHGKGDQPCPRCGGRVTSTTANQRLTNYCRHCQPGMLIRN